jgi:phosphoribosylanthranilate isomerase
MELSVAHSDGMMGWRMSVLIKICGITNLADALVSVEAGADILGFVFYERSPRYIPPQVAREIIRRLPASVVKAGVFVNADKERIDSIIGECGLDMLQFHGEERPEYCLRFGLRTMKAFRIRGPESLRMLRDYGTDAWLLDAYTPGAQGGTGERFDWDLAVEAGSWGRPIFLAGGLTPSNVATALRQVHPSGVDVSSGVEAAPGRKDARKVKSFIAAVREPG